MTSMQLGIMDGATALSQQLFARLDLGLNSVTENALDSLLSALSTEALDVVLAPLSELPIHLSEDLAITALSRRGNAGWRLAVPTRIAREGHPLLMEAGTAVNGADIALTQLLNLREDLVKGEEGALILPWWQMLPLNASTQEVIWVELQPRELVPLPGSGVIAMVCRKDATDTRTTVRQFHHQDTMVVTNVERSLMKLFAEQSVQDCFAWCDKDALGNYRLWGGYIDSDKNVYKAHRTFNTYVGLADSLVNELQSMQNL